MNLDVTVGAISILRVKVMLRAGRLYCADIVGIAVARQTKLGYAAGDQHPRIGRAVRRMTSTASFSLHRRMFESEWPLFIRMTLHASRISASRQSRLFEFKTTMWVMAVAALHRPFEDLVMERQIELMLCLRVTAHT